jgi:hypothetical protein
MTRKIRYKRDQAAKQSPAEAKKFRDGVKQRMRKKLHDVGDKEFLRRSGIKSE